MGTRVPKTESSEMTYVNHAGSFNGNAYQNSFNVLKLYTSLSVRKMQDTFLMLRLVRAKIKAAFVALFNAWCIIEYFIQNVSPRRGTLGTSAMYVKIFWH